MSADSTRQVAFSTPKNAELHAARIAQDTATQRAQKRDEAFEAVTTQLQILSDAYAKAMKDAGVTHYPEALVVVREARAALALANACK